jgi:hypothetical protein
VIKSNEFIEGYSLCRLAFFLEQALNLADSAGLQEYVSADRTDFSRNMIDDNDLTMVPDRMRNCSRFVFSRTSLNAAVHVDCLL